jgi:aminoglycoside phosphotransferase (APT) family kinase protein
MSTPSLRLSPTQRKLTHADLDGLVQRALGVPVVDCAEFTGGYFAAVWRCDLADGRSIVVKLGPRPQVPILTYELDVIASEAEYFRLVRDQAHGVPVPEVLASGHDDELDGDWLMTALLPGTPLADLQGKITEADDAAIRRALGAALATVHTITGTEFGYPGGHRAHAGTWRAAYQGFMGELLADADRLGVDLPVPPARLTAAIERHAHVLDVVRRPALLHFDLWDGNVLVDRDSAGAPRLTGLVDGERYLYGDPLLDLVSPALFRRIEDEPGAPFLAGYADGAGAPVTLDEHARIRLGLYRLHLYLVMNVEPVTRGLTGPEHADHLRFLADLLIGEVSALEGVTS